MTTKKTQSYDFALSCQINADPQQRLFIITPCLKPSIAFKGLLVLSIDLDHHELIPATSIKTDQDATEFTLPEIKIINPFQEDLTRRIYTLTVNIHQDSTVTPISCNFTLA